MATWYTNVNLTWTTAPGSPGTNTWFFRDGVPAGASRQEALDRLENFYISMSNYLPSAVTISSDGTWHGITTDTPNEIDDLAPWTNQGSASGGFLPMGSSIVLRRYAAGGGRTGKGRVFLGPAATSTLQSDGTVTESVRSAIAAAAAQQLILGQQDQSGAFVVYSRLTNTARDIDSFTVADTYGLLRSRRD